MLIENDEQIEIKKACFYCTSQLTNENCTTCNAHSNFEAATGGDEVLGRDEGQQSLVTYGRITDVS